MSLPKLYIETTIPSYLTARRSRDWRLAAHQEMTRRWWDTCRHEYEVYTSAFVREEAASGDSAMAEARLNLLRTVAVLPTTYEAEALAETLLVANLIPVKAAADAFHIAISAVHGMDFLLTWNCAHINNLNVIRRVERICAAAGRPCPVICTPDELLPTSMP
jgi:hypothetical protein